MKAFQNKKILIVEDKPEHEERLKKFLNQKNLPYISAFEYFDDDDVDFSDESSLKSYLERINFPKVVKIIQDCEPDIILLDLAWNNRETEVFNKLMSTPDVMSLWKSLKQDDNVPDVFKLIEYLDGQLKFIPVIILTDWHKAVKLVFSTIYKDRADHIIVKKPQTDWKERFEAELWPEIKHCLNAKEFADNAKELLICASSSNINFYNIAMQAANSDASILIIGETGIGKTVLAEAIHKISKRSEKPFIGRDISGVSKEMAYPILFGHKKYSFTDAKEDRKGILEAAHMGTVFLDEIGDLPLHEQSMLLKAIEEKKIFPLGENEGREVDVRFIFATNKNLRKLVKENFFREELYYRISEIVLPIQPLRERRKDIPNLVQFFYDAYSEKQSGGEYRPLTSRELSAIQDYDFPGNIRQLLTIVKRAITLNLTLVESLSMEERIEIENPMKIHEVITFLWNRMQERDQGLSEIVNEMEWQLINRALIKGHKNIEAAKLLKLKLSTFEAKKSKFKKKENIHEHEKNQL